MNRPEENTAHGELLEQQAFLRRLARHLVGDEHVAEDLAQDANVAALEHAPRGLASMRAWLTRVLRNRAANTTRGERRRTVRELDAARRDLPQTPDEVAQRLTVQRRVIAAVDALSEPYKTTIYLRYYADLGPTAIAERMEVPLPTVKARLARGLDRLRAELDAGYGGDRSAWAVCLAGTIHVDMAIATSVATGGAVMAATSVGTKWIAGAVAVALAGWIGTSVVQHAAEPAKIEPPAMLVADRESAATPHDSRESAHGDGLRVPTPEADDVARIAAPNAAPIEATPVVELTREQLWEQEYRDAAASELEAAAKVISEEIHKGSYPELSRRFELGLGEYLYPGPDIHFDKVDSEKITLLSQRPDGIYRVILPENEFPDLYQLKAKLHWLRAEAQKREVEEYLEAQKALQDSTSR